MLQRNDGSQSGRTVAALADWIAARGRFTALVGAGGKTTLMFALAQEMAARGSPGIITTTTHIWVPDALPLAEDMDALQHLRRRHPIVVYGRPGADGKLSLPPDWDADALQTLADYIWIEADGSRGLPCKVPAAHEPCIPPAADIVLGVAGLQALDRPFMQACCRLPEALALLGRTAEDRISEADLAHILASPQGIRKGVGARHYAAILHQCDTPSLARRADRIKTLLAAEGVTDVCCTARVNKEAFL